jgi:UrcA family protein
MQRTHSLAPVVGTLLALGMTFGAVAAESVPANARSITIAYGDLELGNGLGVDKLHARIAAAAERACGQYDSRDLRARKDWRSCYDAAVAGAFNRVQLTAFAGPAANALQQTR